ncbi:hypothetical protein [Conexibacter sp. CPCC 206217]|uniref:hypothetical protein n=1 Tax=Conexibacter sp. CPCC 206217 TaxID=3064574 RepID=UPI002717A8EF|nr:hypothetical protein [Conexibacter sp. CPCC 206217]MDO8212451.1 hypothetical protein [Conexibacter sp. CPCC 206217]
MFNALSSEQLLVGVGRVLRSAADANGTLEDYQRSQTLSAYSVTRLLAAELAGATELLAWTRAELTTALRGDDRARVGEARERIAVAANGVELGEAVADLLAALPRDPADETRTAVQHVLRELTDREQAALAAPLPG